MNASNIKFIINWQITNIGKLNSLSPIYNSDNRHFRDADKKIENEKNQRKHERIKMKEKKNIYFVWNAVVCDIINR